MQVDFERIVDMARYVGTARRLSMESVIVNEWTASRI